MRKHIVYLAFLAFAVLAVGASSSFAAGSGSRMYVFNGRLLADAGSSSTLFLDVNGGNQAALRKLIGKGDNQPFAVDSNTEYLRWTKGVPTVVPESNLVAGDRVSIKVRAQNDASLADIEATAAVVVADRGPNAGFAHRPLWLFVGTLKAPAANGHFTLHITNGNLLGLRAMLGQPLDETFSYDSGTIFVLWQGRVPTLISAGQLKVGDKISVRIRAPRDSSLSQVEGTPANHVGDHEPGA